MAKAAGGKVGNTTKQKPVAVKKASGKAAANRKKSPSALPVTSFGANVCGDPARSLDLEWLETNGIGGFASSSVSGANTRRYHGLLVAAVQPPAGRIVALSKLEETFFAPESAFPLSTNKYTGALFPDGYSRIISFSLDPFPRWVFGAGGCLIEKTVFLEYEVNAVWIRYRLLTKKGLPLKKAPEGVRFAARPLFAFRDYHHIVRKHDFCDIRARETSGGLFLKPYEGLPGIYMETSGGGFHDAPDWYYNFEYERELERGLDYVEDLFSPGVFESRAGVAEWILRFSFNKCYECVEGQGGIAAELELRMAAEIERRKSLCANFEGADDAARKLAVSADQFIVKRGQSGRTVIAGYHWFTDWGRDTMISLPGLALATGRFEVAREILTTFSKHARYGLLPNRFPEAGESPSYNSVDAALLYILTVNEYIKASGDEGILREVWGTMESIIGGFRQGTLNDIFMDDDGLISAGGPGTQLTWMDAKVGDWVVTPRHGKAVEINAMWYNCLCEMAELAPQVDVDGSFYSGLASIVKAEFESRFWNGEKGCMYDVVRGDFSDGAVRPNQAIALALPRELLDSDKRESALRVIERKLLTPYGLRSLAPDEPGYRGRYAGGVIDRDGAYHQGTVWGWLMGPFVFALWNVRGRTPETMKYVTELIKPLEQHLSEAGLNSVSEIFDGDAPHKPCGCIAQAWSVAELLRIKNELNKYY